MTKDYKAMTPSIILKMVHPMQGKLSFACAFCLAMGGQSLAYGENSYNPSNLYAVNSAVNSQMASPLPLAKDVFSPENMARIGVSQPFSNDNKGLIFLKPEWITHDADIRFSDLLTNFPLDKDQVIAKAPDPGKSSKISAQWLQELSKRVGVNWQPINPNDSIEIKRLGYELDPDRIRKIIEDFIIHQGKIQLSDHATIELNPNGKTIILPTNVPLDGEVINWRIDPKSYRFEAQLAIPNRASAVQQILVSGKIENKIRVPVAIRKLQRGEILGMDNLAYALLPDSSLGNYVILDAKSLLGMEVLTPLSEGRPILQNSVAPQRLVKNGDNVIMSFQSEAMQLTVAGKALEDGILGQTIKVRNDKSKIQLEGVVEGQGRIRVLSSRPTNLAVN